MCFAQNESSISHTKTVNDSTLIKIHAIVEDIDFRMHGLDRYKLYPTEIYIISAIRYNDRENRNCTMVFG